MGDAGSFVVKRLTSIRVGARVRILQPNDVAGKSGTILSQEFIGEEQSSDRWIVQVEAEDIVLSLQPDEFLVFNYPSAES